MLHPIGPRVVVEPIVTKPSDIIETTDRTFQQMGRVLGIGKGYCPECNGVADFDVNEGDIVLFHTTVGHEITSSDGDEYLVIGFQDVLAVYEPDEDAPV